jgi:hypothetical protein
MPVAVPRPPSLGLLRKQLKAMERKGRIDPRLAEFRDEQGIRKEGEGQAVMESIAEQSSTAMKQERLCKKD